MINMFKKLFWLIVDIFGVILIIMFIGSILAAPFAILFPIFKYVSFAFLFSLVWLIIIIIIHEAYKSHNIRNNSNNSERGNVIDIQIVNTDNDSLKILRDQLLMEIHNIDEMLENQYQEDLKKRMEDA